MTEASLCRGLSTKTPSADPWGTARIIPGARAMSSVAAGAFGPGHSPIGGIVGSIRTIRERHRSYGVPDIGLWVGAC